MSAIRINTNSIIGFLIRNKWISLVLLFRLLLDICFFVYLDVFHDYAGFEIHLSLSKYVVSILFTVFLLILVPKETSTVSEAVIQFFYLAVYVPFASYFSLTDSSYEWFCIFTGFWLVVCLLNKIDYQWREIRPPREYDPKLFVYTIAFLSLLVFGLIFTFSDVKFNFSLLDVYELREENPTGAVPLAGYLINWTGKIFLPFLLIYSIVKSKHYFNVYSMVVMAAIILLFSVTGHKSYLMMIPAIIGTIWLFRTGKFFLNLLIVFCSLTFVGLLLLYFTDNQLFLSLFVRRTLYVPAQLSFYYFDFFQGNPIYLSNSIFSSIFDYPYEVQPPRVIADVYYNRPEISANNGIISDGFANFGILGVAIWAFLFSFILKVMDWLSKDKNPLIFWTLILLGLRVFIGGSLLTGVLTHGIIIMVLITFLYPPNRVSQQTKL